MSLAAGTRFGPYDVIAPLGAGGMGEVYRARDRRLARDAALKILPADERSDATSLARFEREARVLATLSHPNIATLFGVEESAHGLRALAMELVEGQPLSDHLARPDRAGGLTLREALSIARQLAEGLEAAHAHGIVHRDLKPANVMVRPDGTVKVLDFGLATSAATGDESQQCGSTVTTVGSMVGTPSYMSPEQARGYAVDRRTDIWAFGCVLFELLTGRRAFGGSTTSDVIAAVLEHEPDWTALPPSISPAVRRVLEHCLVKDPRRRLRDIGDALIELDDAELEATARASQPDVLSLRRWRGATAICAAIALSALVWIATRPAPPPPAAGRFALAFSPDAPLGAIGSTEVGQIAISPDGSRIVYPTLRGLAVRTVDALDVSLIDLPGESANHPFFSPDGRWIGYGSSANMLRRVPASGGSSVFVANTGSGAMGTWGQAGILYTDQQGLFRVPPEGGAPVAVDLHLDEQEQATFPEILPGGRAVLFSVIPTRSNTPETVALDSTARIDALDLASGARKTVVRGGGHPRYLPTGHLAFGAGSSLRAVGFDVRTLQMRGTPIELTSDAGAAYFEVAANGTLVYVRGAMLATPSALVWVDREGHEEPLGAPPMPYLYPRISPDGRRVALDVALPNRDIYIWDFARRVLERFTTDPAEDAVVRWTPDGAKLAFANSRYGVPNVFWQAADGSGVPERIYESPVLQHPLAFARDGRIVVAEVAPGLGRGLKLLSPGPVPQLDPLVENASTAEISPNGRWLAYGSTQSGQFEVYVTSFPTAQGRWRISSDGGRQPLWSRDGRELFYRDFNGAVVAVPVQLSPTFSPGRGRKLFENALYRGAGPSLSDRAYDLSPDGGRFLMIRQEQAAPRTLVLVQRWLDDVRHRVPLAGTPARGAS